MYRLVDGGFAMQAAAANDEIGMGFIGTGVRGSFLLTAFQGVPGVRPVMVADLYDGYLERAKADTDGKIETTKHYEDVLNRGDIHAVAIATPDHLHKKMVLDALDAGKHVYIEKPMTWSIPEGVEIIEAVKKSGKLLQVGSQPRTGPLAVKAREIVASGQLGQVTMVRMAEHRNTAEGAWVWPIPPDASPETVEWERFLGPSPKKAFDPKVFFRWRCWWAYSGGVATDLFVHQFTLMHYVMGVKAPKSAVSNGGLYRWKDGRDVPDVLNTILEYEEGYVADHYVNLVNGFPTPSALIMGEDATLEMRGNAVVVQPFTRRPPVMSYGVTAWTKEMKAAYYEERGYTAEGRPKEPLPPAKEAQEIPIERGPEHHELFIMALREGKPSAEDEYEGHHAAGAAHLANLAYREGRRMQWNPVTGDTWAG